MRVRRIGVIAYEGVEGLDVVGPLDTFAAANALCGRARGPYDLMLLGLRDGPVVMQSGAALLISKSLDSAPALDTVIVPGGSGIRTTPAIRTPVAKWLKARAGQIRRVSSVCTGIYALAEAGLLDGRNATTHWKFAGEVRSRWPKIAVNSNAIYVKSGRYYTSAGITAGIDLALAMIEEDLGTALALNVARHLVVYLKRPGGQLQYSEPLRLQELSGGTLSDTISWMLEHLDQELSVDVLAEHAHLSPRHFARKFKAQFHITPAEFVESLRLDHARWLLANDSCTLDSLASAVGYASDDSFRRAFTRRFGSVPSDYRRRIAGR
jgi:transcriptional regulator GlxA family with amidase domain